MDTTYVPDAERRKQVRLCVRADLVHSRQRYEGKIYHVVKDPVGLKYYRFNDQEYYVFQLLDGKRTLEDVRTNFETEFRPHRLTLEDLEQFARQLVTSGLVNHESALAGRHLFQKRRKNRLTKKLMGITNILYIKLPVFDPDRILNVLYKNLSWIFTKWFLVVSIAYMLAAIALITMKWSIFWDKLPAQNEFFNAKTVVYMWISLGIVKVIHEFGHGLSCKAFGGECHEMGALLMCFSPALYCNVTDSWTLADKWKRIIISFAGIYVELIIAATSTFVWWYTPMWPFVNNLALSLMTLCSISTFVFNANPLMRFDGYYILADWLEVPNLRERSNRYLMNAFNETCLGIEVPPEPYMAPSRKVLFVTYAVTSYIYRWIVTFSIIWFLSGWLKPYKLQSLSLILAFAAVATMIFWPMFRVAKNIRQRGRLPDMKRKRVAVTLLVCASLLAGLFLVPLPVSRIREKGLIQFQEDALIPVYPADSGFLQRVAVFDGQRVLKGQLLAEFTNPKMEEDYLISEAQASVYHDRLNALKSAPVKKTPDSQNAYSQWNSNLTQSTNDEKKYRDQARVLKEQLGALNAIKAPRDGVVMGIPHQDEYLKMWERSDQKALCKIGDPSKLRILVPVGPLDYQLLAEHLQKYHELEVSIRVAGRADRIMKGVITHLPEAPAKDVPVGLTSKGGGSLAIKPTSQQNQIEPLVQTYLVDVKLLDPDEAVVPGTLATVKIHTAWKTGAWYIWRNIATALDVGLLR
ncbi:hypothetical protein KIH39_10735 [Telmatocola sphagniphila]|uniref:Uncharacterized protein n=1 Tax=Telmatocola sphagniphila TaxID=1123043 RepID=A0A8E6BBY5_9BACT|nr:hypothetical protein [Telmatocola sphagniphila]QVL34353.1 hypothetical protein KIH39_10735 [Telmatocola sphagniphila]